MEFLRYPPPNFRGFLMSSVATLGTMFTFSCQGLAFDLMSYLLGKVGMFHPFSRMSMCHFLPLRLFPIAWVCMWIEDLSTPDRSLKSECAKYYAACRTVMAATTFLAEFLKSDLTFIKPNFFPVRPTQFF